MQNDGYVRSETGELPELFGEVNRARKGKHRMHRFRSGGYFMLVSAGRKNGSKFPTDDLVAAYAFR